MSEHPHHANPRRLAWIRMDGLDMGPPHGSEMHLPVARRMPGVNDLCPSCGPRFGDVTAGGGEGLARARALPLVPADAAVQRPVGGALLGGSADL